MNEGSIIQKNIQWLKREKVKRMVCEVKLNHKKPEMLFQKLKKGEKDLMSERKIGLIDVINQNDIIMGLLKSLQLKNQKVL